MTDNPTLPAPIEEMLQHVRRASEAYGAAARTDPHEATWEALMRDTELEAMRRVIAKYLPSEQNGNTTKDWLIGLTPFLLGVAVALGIAWGLR